MGLTSGSANCVGHCEMPPRIDNLTKQYYNKFLPTRKHTVSIAKVDGVTLFKTRFSRCEDYTKSINRLYAKKTVFMNAEVGGTCRNP